MNIIRTILLFINSKLIIEAVKYEVIAVALPNSITIIDNIKELILNNVILFVGKTLVKYKKITIREIKTPEYAIFLALLKSYKKSPTLATTY